MKILILNGSPRIIGNTPAIQDKEVLSEINSILDFFNN